MPPIRTAVLGFGTAGRVFHAPLVSAEPRFQLSAIVTGSPERAAAAQSEYTEVDVLPDADAVFDRASELDLVVIGTPNETHAPLARRAIDAGLAVVIDKPVAVSSAEARAVVAAASAARVPLTVFQNRRWDGDFLTLSDTISAGELGEVQQFESSFEWWKPSLGERWKDTAGVEAGGGILYDLGPHLIDQAVQLFGPVGSVHAELDRRRDGATSDDDSFVTLHHVSGVRSRLWMSAVSPAPRPRFRVVGSEAVFTSNGLDPQEPQSIAGRRPGTPGFGIHDDRRTARLERPGGAETAVTLRAGDHLAFYRLLGDALLDGAPLPVDPEDSIRSLELIETALEIAR